MSLSHGPSIVKSGLVMCLDAANKKSYSGAGTVWSDMIDGVNNTPTMVGTVTANAGSFTFPGVDTNYFYDATISLPNITTASAITILCWCKPDSTGPANPYSGLVAIGEGAATGLSNAILLSINTKLSNYYVGSAYFFNDYIPNNLVVTKDAWNMAGIVARTAATTNNTTLVLGNASGLSYSTGSSSSYTKGLAVAQTKLRIGCTDYTGARPMKGDIAVVLIYNRELTTQEISQNFNALRGRFGI